MQPKTEDIQLQEDLVPRRSTLAAIKELGVQVKAQKNVIIFGFFMCAGMLLATLGVVVLGIEVTKDMKTDNGRLVVKGTDELVATASAETNMSGSIVMDRESGKPAQTKALQVGVNPLKLYNSLQESGTRADAIKTLDHYQKIRVAAPVSARRANSTERNGGSALLRRAAVDAMEVFEVFPEEGSNITEPDEVIAVATTPLGRFALQPPRGWIPISSAQYDDASAGRSLRAAGSKRRSLFWCGGWRKRSRSLLAVDSEGKQVMPWEERDVPVEEIDAFHAERDTRLAERRQALDAQKEDLQTPGRQLKFVSYNPGGRCNRYLNQFVNRANAVRNAGQNSGFGSPVMNNFFNNIDTMVPASFEQSRSALDTLGKCAKNKNYLANLNPPPFTTWGAWLASVIQAFMSSFFGTSSVRLQKAAMYFYEFVVEVSSTTCPGPSCVTTAFVGPFGQFLTTQTNWCTMEPDVLVDLFCEYMLAHYQNLYGLDIMSDCGLYAMYIEEISIFASDPSFDLCDDASIALENVVCKAAESGDLDIDSKGYECTDSAGRQVIVEK